MSISRIQTGQRMSQAVIYNGVVETAGVVARNVPGEDVRSQTTDILATIEELLDEAGTDKSRLLKATIWLSDISTFNEMNAVWDEWVAPGQTPCRACVEAKLASEQYAVEIQVSAAV